jgi:acyl-CoA thioesterase I
MNMSRRQALAIALIAPLLWTGCAKFEPPHVRVDEFDGRTIRVACVGDSITYGAGVDDRENRNYPRQLGELLGPTFEVRNFGRNGATLSRTGDLPYWTTDEFTAATEFVPDVVILMLGTNDTKPQNWRNDAAFASDLRDMLHHFTRLKNRPRTKVWVCLPVPVYATQWGINSETLENSIIPTIMQVCNKEKIPVIDLNDALTGRPELFPDKIHPNADGATLMAQTIYQAIRP